MLKTRFLALVAAFAVGFAPILACAAAVKAPVVYDAAGRPIQSTPVICVDTTGAYFACGGTGGSILITTHTAAPTCTDLSTVCGLWTNLKGGLGVTLYDSSGNELSANGGTGTVGSAPPSTASYTGVNASGVVAAMIGCDKSITYDASTSGETQLVAASGSTVIYVCGYSLFTPGTVNLNLASADTGGSCANPVKLTPAYQLTAQSGFVDGAPFWRGMKTPAGKALCLNTSGAVAAQAVVYYGQF